MINNIDYYKLNNNKHNIKYIDNLLVSKAKSLILLGEKQKVRDIIKNIDNKFILLFYYFISYIPNNLIIIIKNFWKSF